MSSRRDGGSPSPLRIVALAPFVPSFAAEHGGARLLARWLDGLGRRHRVALLALRAPGEVPVDPTLRARLELCETLPRLGRARALSAGGRLRKKLRAAAALVGTRPAWAAWCRSPPLRARLRELDRSWRPDVVHAHYHVMGQYLGALGAGPLRVLEEPEPGAAAAEDALARSRGWSRVLARADLAAWRRYERRIAGDADAVVVFTERDADAMRAVAPDVRPETIPFPAAVPRRPADPRGSGPPTVLFVGGWDHPPNREAALRLAFEILPRVRRDHPEARLRLVGASPPPELLRDPPPGVAVAGFVDQLDAELDHASVVVAPLASGGGMRVKVVEALAAGKALVASPRALEGLPVVHGLEVLRAEGDEETATAIATLLADGGLRERLARAARAWSERHFDPEAWIDRYDRLYESLAAGGPGRTEHRGSLREAGSGPRELVDA